MRPLHVIILLGFVTNFNRCMAAVCEGNATNSCNDQLGLCNDVGLCVVDKTSGNCCVLRKDGDFDKSCVSANAEEKDPTTFCGPIGITSVNLVSGPPASFACEGNATNSCNGLLGLCNDVGLCVVDETSGNCCVLPKDGDFDKSCVSANAEEKDPTTFCDQNLIDVINPSLKPPASFTCEGNATDSCNGLLGSCNDVGLCVVDETSGNCCVLRTDGVFNNCVSANAEEKDPTTFCNRSIIDVINPSLKPNASFACEGNATDSCSGLLGLCNDVGLCVVDETSGNCCVLRTDGVFNNCVSANAEEKDPTTFCNPIEITPVNSLSEPPASFVCEGNATDSCSGLLGLCNDVGLCVVDKTSGNCCVLRTDGAFNSCVSANVEEKDPTTFCNPIEITSVNTDEDTPAVPVWQPVSYECIFISKWNAESHPIDYPNLSFWSPPVLVSHAEEYTMWKEGENASPGVVTVAEEGVNTLLSEEVFGSIFYKDAFQGLEQNASSSSGTISQTLFDLRLDENHQLISSISKVSPSPDWFTGFAGYRPVNAVLNTWLDNFVLDTFPFDSGTRDGETYVVTDSDGPTNPQQPIQQITNAQGPSTFVFVNGNGEVDPIATWDCVRQRTEYASVGIDSTRRPLPIDETIINEDPIISTVTKSTSTEVEYTITFTGTWTATNHPFGYPFLARFIAPLVVSHNDAFELWHPGKLSSDSIVQMAQGGVQSGLEEDITAGKTIGDVASHVTAPDDLDPSGVTQEVGVISLNADQHLISSVTKIFPSPDWFTGFSNIDPLTEDGFWLKEFSIDVFPMDAGSMSGPSYTDMGEATDPRNVITRITPSATVNKDIPVFVSTGEQEGAFNYPVGRFDFTLRTTDTPTTQSSLPPSTSIAPSAAAGPPPNPLIPGCKWWCVKLSYPWTSDDPNVRTRCDIMYSCSECAECSSERGNDGEL